MTIAARPWSGLMQTLDIEYVAGRDTRTRGFYGAKILSNGSSLENVDRSVYCIDTERLPPVRARDCDP